MGADPELAVRASERCTSTVLGVTYSFCAMSRLSGPRRQGRRRASRSLSDARPGVPSCAAVHRSRTSPSRPRRRAGARRSLGQLERPPQRLAGVCRTPVEAQARAERGERLRQLEPAGEPSSVATASSSAARPRSRSTAPSTRSAGRPCRRAPLPSATVELVTRGTRPPRAGRGDPGRVPCWTATGCTAHDAPRRMLASDSAARAPPARPSASRSDVPDLIQRAQAADAVRALLFMIRAAGGRRPRTPLRRQSSPVARTTCAGGSSRSS